MNRNIFSIPFALILLFAFVTAVLSPSMAMAQDKGLESLRETGLAFRSVAKRVSPAVVFVKVEKNVQAQGGEQNFSPFGTPFGDELFQRFFGTPPHEKMPHSSPRKRQLGQGSGFLISPDGYILTNNHVVGDADSVAVQLLDGREYKAEIVGTDSGSDLAVIKVDESDLPFLRLGDSDKLEVGDWVLAFGNPFGLSHSLTAGVVSAKGRSGIGLNDYEDFIQTDAAINPGNSGGPLVNLDGEVVGINTAIFSRSGGYMGIGFTIPVNMAKNIRDQLIEHGKVTRGQLGVYIQEMTQDLAETFGMKNGEGILVAKVIEGSPAEDAGLKRGDVIVELNGETIDTISAFRNRISLTSPGTKVRLTVVRDGDKKVVSATIGELEGASSEQPGKANQLSDTGLSLQQLTPELAKRYGYDTQSGVLIINVSPGSRADRSGIKRGALLLEVNQHPVETVAEATQLLTEDDDKSLLLLIQQGNSTLYIVLKPE